MLGVVAMLTRQQPPVAQTRLHRCALVLAATFGRARVIFGLFFAVAAAAAFADHTEDLLVLYVAGSLLLWNQPIQAAAERIAAITSSTIAAAGDVAVRSVAQPRTAFVAVAAGVDVRVGQGLMRGGDRIGVVVDMTETEDPRMAETLLEAGNVVRAGDLLTLAPAAEANTAIVGAVGRGTSLDRVVLRGNASHMDDLGLAEGGLVEADVRGRSMLYQIVDVEVESAQPEGASISKRLRVGARKLGIWDLEQRSFASAEWIPQPGVPVSTVRSTRETEFDPRFVGRVPGTEYGAAYDPVTGATHNTAILGILGIGKTTLAVELIWRTLEQGAKVIVIDITNEYATHFDGLLDLQSRTLSRSDSTTRSARG